MEKFFGDSFAPIILSDIDSYYVSKLCVFFNFYLGNYERSAGPGAW